MSSVGKEGRSEEKTSRASCFGVGPLRGELQDDDDGDGYGISSWGEQGGERGKKWKIINKNIGKKEEDTRILSESI